MFSGGGVPEVELDMQDNFTYKSPTERGDFLPLKKKNPIYLSHNDRNNQRKLNRYQIHMYIHIYMHIPPHIFIYMYSPYF